MIKSTELRLGNLIYDTEGKVNTVDLTALKYILQYDGIHQAKPIPLAEEWLLKFNFKKANGYFYSPSDPVDVTYEYEIEGLHFYGRFHFNIKHNVGYFAHHWCEGESNQEESVTRSVGYVHDLQNLFYSLTGEELTIK